MGYLPSMRTLLEIDDDVLAAAQKLAAERRVPTGAVISELLRKALPPSAPAPLRTKNDFPLLPTAGGTAVTTEMVHELLEQQDVESAA